MGFSSSLQGQASHEALLGRQDAEIKLLDTMRRCLTNKVKSDRDYASTISSLTTQGRKVERSEDLAGSLIAQVIIQTHFKSSIESILPSTSLNHPHVDLKTSSQYSIETTIRPRNAYPVQLFISRCFFFFLSPWETGFGLIQTCDLHKRRLFFCCCYEFFYPESTASLQILLRCCFRAGRI